MEEWRAAHPLPPRPPKCSAAEWKRLPYQEHLKTPHWHATRLSCVERAGNRCQVCGTPGACLGAPGASLEAHHRSYRRKGEADEVLDLIAVCRTCHAVIHAHVKLH